MEIYFLRRDALQVKVINPLGALNPSQKAGKADRDRGMDKMNGGTGMLMSMVPTVCEAVSIWSIIKLALSSCTEVPLFLLYRSL
jgi:hypothetical protein